MKKHFLLDIYFLKNTLLNTLVPIRISSLFTIVTKLDNMKHKIKKILCLDVAPYIMAAKCWWL